MMKNRFYVYMVSVTSIAFAVGCTVDEYGDQGGKDSLTSFPVEITARTPLSADEASAEQASKTIPYELSERVYFEPGDQIALSAGALIDAERYVSVTYTADIDSPEPSATFIREDVNWQYEEGDYYLAAYPAASVNRWGSTGTSACYFRLPQPQMAREGSWDARAGLIASMSKSAEFSFEHCAAYIKFTVTSSMPQFKCLRIAYPDAHKVIAGDSQYVEAAVFNEIQVKYRDGQIDVVDFKADRSRLVSDYHLYTYPDSKAEIVFPDNLPFAEGTYYIAILPKTYPDGLSLVFESPEGEYAAKRIEGPFTLAPGDVVTFQSIGDLNFKPAIQNHTVWSDAGGDNQGVVFWVDHADPSRALIVSSCTHQNVSWASVATPSGATFDDPVQNYETIVSRDDYTDEKFPAVAYCKSLRDTYGGDWHLPSIEELRILYNSYYGRTYISPLSSPYNVTDGENVVTYSGNDFRYHPTSGQTSAEYQTILSAKKAFDELLTQIGEQNASLDGAKVIGGSGNLSIDPESVGTFGTQKGVTYWISKELKADGTSQGANAHYGRIGEYNYSNAVKTNVTSVYVRCVRSVSL